VRGWCFRCSLSAVFEAFGQQFSLSLSALQQQCFLKDDWVDFALRLMISNLIQEALS
jgi:hypothetical protein